MSLRVVESAEKEEIEGTGYKIVSVRQHGFRTICSKILSNYGVWIERQPTEYGEWTIQNVLSETSYPIGFHLFLKPECAEGYLWLCQKVIPQVMTPHMKVVEISYRNLLARGKEHDIPIVVAEFIKIDYFPGTAHK